MANITLSGTLLDPNSGFAARDKIRFTHKTTTGSTLKGSVSTLVIGADGAYSIDLQYGLVLVERRDSTKSQYINLGVVTVNADNPATTLPELLSATVPVSSEELIEFQSILADCVAAQEAAEAAVLPLGTNTGASLVGTSSGATVQQSLDALTDGQTGGLIVFTTYALLDAYTPQNATEEKSSFKVTNDSNTALNGYYSWVSGTAYAKDADLVVNTIDANNTSDAVSGFAVDDYTVQKLLPVIDSAREMFGNNDPAFITGFKVREATGEVVADAAWSYIDLFEVELGNYEVQGYFDSNGIAGYDKDGVYTEGFDSGVNGTQIYSFEITNPLTRQLRVSTFNSKLPNFYFIKTDDTLAVNNLQKELEINQYIYELWVDQATGNDINSGKATAPLETINAAIEKIKTLGGVIVIKEGDYYETLNLDDLESGSVKIQAHGTDRVRIMGSDVISGFVKTAGRTNIYEAPFTGTIELTGNVSSYGYRIFEDNVPSLEIPIGERHALQRSQSHRLPYSEIKQIDDQGSLSANLDFLDAMPTGQSGYWKDGTDIYVVNAAHGDVSLSAIHYAVRQSTTSTVLDSVRDRANVDLEIRDLQFFYSSEKGLDLYRFGKVTAWHVGVFGARQTGFDEQKAHSSINMVEVGGCGRDGIASQLYFPVPNEERQKERWNKYRDIWCHDNYDDGFSTHMNGSNDIDGFLLEYNGDTGLQNVGCTYCVVKNGVARNNTKGIVVNGAGTSIHSRGSTTLDGYNILSTDNIWNFESSVSPGNAPAVMNLYNCISRNAATNGYRADGAGEIGIANNCKSTGDTVANNGFTIVNDNYLS